MTTIFYIDDYDLFFSDNALSSSVPENKKKKERRKDKENAVETSDEEAASIQGKILTFIYCM